MSTTREVPVAGGHVALVDEEDFERVSQRPWHLERKGYVVTVIYDWPVSKSQVKLHRLILQPPAGVVVDHANGDRLDNRRANLRTCTVGQNSTNRRKIRQSLSRRPGTPYRGVSWKDDCPGKPWQARIGAAGRRRIYLGTFATQEEAARVYDVVAREWFGEFARLNFPRPGEQSAILTV